MDKLNREELNTAKAIIKQVGCVTAVIKNDNTLVTLHRGMQWMPEWTRKANNQLRDSNLRIRIIGEGCDGHLTFHLRKLTLEEQTMIVNLEMLQGKLDMEA